MKLYNANLIRVHRKLIRSISELNDHFMITSVTKHFGQMKQVLVVRDCPETGLDFEI
jgi:hypothetical protein